MQRDQLADFLRRRREAIRPAEVGLADGPRRRTAGLRREEVAMLAGMSVDYVVRLEQGRSSQPSTQLLGALARALRLSDDERDHLFHLAGHQPPPADGVARLARAGLIRMLDLLGDTPALVMSDLGEVLAQNRASRAADRRPHRLHRRPALSSRTAGSPSPQPAPSARPRSRSTTPASSWPTCARPPAAAPATRRSPGSSTGCGPRAPSSAGSGPSTRWRSGAPTARPSLHPRVGRLVMDCETLVTPDQGQQLLVLTPADAEARERLDLLRVLGTRSSRRPQCGARKPRRSSLTGAERRSRRGRG